MNKLLTTIKKLIGRLNVILNYYKTIANNNNKVQYDQPIIFIDLKDRRFGVYYPCLLYFLHEGGYQLVVNKSNILSIGNYGSYFKYVSSFKKLSYNTINYLDKQGLEYDCICDFENVLNNNAKRSFILNFNYYSYKNNQTNSISIPYPLHPANYFVTKKITHLSEYRKQLRRFKIFFSGNTLKDAYDNAEMKNNFTINSRYEIIETVKKGLNKQQIFVVTDLETWNNINQTGFDGLVLNDWYWLSNYKYNIKAKISSDKWLETIATASFFLCCPGVVMPHSHNIFEAMSVGTIPLIQFGDIFYPPLQDNVNAIFFKDTSDLINKIKYIIGLSQEEIARLSKNTIEYYEKHCSPQSLVKKTRSLKEGKYTTFINVESVSITKYYKDLNLNNSR